VPGVAEAAALVLGGVTARDRSDLLALGVLVPLGLMLRSSGGSTAAPVGPVGPARLRRVSGFRRASLGVSTAAPLMGALAAVVTATATSCAPDPAVTRVVGQGSDLYAFIGGVLVRTTSGTWERTRVLSVPPDPATSLERGLSKFMPAFGLVLAAGVWLVGRRRWPSWPMGLAVVAAGWGISVAAGGALGFAFEPAFDPMRFIGWLTLGGAVVTSVVAVAVARRPHRPLTPPPHIAYRVPLPTPPHPTPPPPPSPTDDHGWPPPP